MNLYSDDINFLAGAIEALNKVNQHDGGTLYVDRVPICNELGLQGFLVDEADAWSWREATDEEREAYKS